jgi:hypothetical protein
MDPKPSYARWLKNRLYIGSGKADIPPYSRLGRMALEVAATQFFGVDPEAMLQDAQVHVGAQCFAVNFQVTA